jgi:hypothetical protein
MEDMDRLRSALTAIEDHRYQGFYDWFGIGELIAAARGVLRGAQAS